MNMIKGFKNFKEVMNYLNELREKNKFLMRVQGNTDGQPDGMVKTVLVTVLLLR